MRTLRCWTAWRWPKALSWDGNTQLCVYPECFPLGELAGGGEVQHCAALGVVDADGHGGHVDQSPGERDYLGEAHAGVEAEAVGVARHRVAHRGLEAPVPARQHLGGRLDAAVVHQCSTGLRRSSKSSRGGSSRSWCRISPMSPEAKRGNQARFGKQVSVPPLGLKLSPRRPCRKAWQWGACDVPRAVAAANRNDT